MKRLRYLCARKKRNPYPMKTILSALIAGRTLSREEAHDVLVGITRQQYNEHQIAALLMGIQMHGVTVDELLGFADGLLETGNPVDLGGCDTLDIVGTGGDGKNTFNISTCSAFVIAGAGYKVSKHGNGSATSVSGASDVLAAHGVKFTGERDVLLRALDEAGVCYLHAPLFAVGMKYVGPTRKALQIPTCFNLLGPLVNPARPKYNFFGTANAVQQQLYGAVMRARGKEFAIVNSADGYDEVSLTGAFSVLTADGLSSYTPEALGLAPVLPQDLYGGDTKEEAVAIFDAVLSGEASAARKNVVVANAAMAIHLISPGQSLEACVAMAKESLDSGKAQKAFRKFVEIYS